MSLLQITPLKGAPWLPTSEATLKAWWRGDSNTLSGSDVLTMVDKSTSGITLSTTATRRQVYNATGLNGQPVYNGIAAKNCRAGSASTTPLFTTGTPMCMYIVMNTTLEAANGFTQLVGGYESGTACFQMFTTNGLAGYRNMNFGRGATVAVACVGITTYTYSANHYLIIEYNGGTTTAAASWKAWRNQVSQTVTTSGNLGGGAGGTYLGENGAAAAHSQDATGFTADVAFFMNKTVDATLLANIGGYMSQRYNL